MKAAVLNQHTFTQHIEEVQIPEILPHHVLIKIKAASINHHELWSIKEQSKRSPASIIMGSDGAGEVVAPGLHSNPHLMGQEVIINPSLDWGNDPRTFGKTYHILGFPQHGTFAEYLAIHERYVVKKPPHLSLEEAAAIPLAGLTAYRALFTKGQLKKGDKVLITGIGGGAALLALAFAVHAGAEVYVSSGNEEKLNEALKAGAKGGANYKTEGWAEKLMKTSGGFDLIIDSASGPGFSELIYLANPGGTIVLYGRTAGMLPVLDPQQIFLKQLSILGTSMGTEQEFEAMVNFVSLHQIKPVIDSSYPLAEIQHAFKKMKSGDQFGKIIINMPA
ncbi:zinc-binding dehydrogenase [Pedobacter caeni]|uniref:D-arabinose 1-dehydrogenase, Zn-dependent alcohol dehydrogenase family n=1 Tax=Pedobacter caeni TaxID=288992 RepID=A0A1M5DQ97_9SPHI|nr:zinc-binding dehydrogenase [Pedobacter caeni]SHF69143.1 D-arabinose 1-dehydrogenase, Zn-dependent alcohol dehydrogenase family [Pedobacter caeni]